jgi:hypothetical protein
MNHRVKVVLIALGYWLGVPSLVAHHGTARFDMSHIVTLQGAVTDFQWSNPHPYIHAELNDESGKVANWTLECGSPLMLKRFGWSPDTVKRGDRVKVYGFRAKDGSPYMHLEKIDLPNGKSLPGFP